MPYQIKCHIFNAISNEEQQQYLEILGQNKVGKRQKACLQISGGLSFVKALDQLFIAPREEKSSWPG